MTVANRTMQMCMQLPSNLMQSLEMNSVTNARSSGDGGRTLTLTPEHHVPVGAECCSTLKKAKELKRHIEAKGEGADEALTLIPLSEKDPSQCQEAQ